MDLLDIAQRFGVKVEYRDHLPAEFTLTGVHAMFGCIPAQNTVLVRSDAKGKESEGAEGFLHELVHVLLTPPGENIETIHEAWMLLPFERILARETMSKKDYRKVLEYQSSTSIDIWEGRTCYMILDDVPNPESKDWWREGIDRAKKVGMLDVNGKVTWHRAAWPTDLEELTLSSWRM